MQGLWRKGPVLGSASTACQSSRDARSAEAPVGRPMAARGVIDNTLITIQKPDLSGENRLGRRGRGDYNPATRPGRLGPPLNLLLPDHLIACDPDLRVMVAGAAAAPRSR